MKNCLTVQLTNSNSVILQVRGRMGGGGGGGGGATSGGGGVHTDN